MEDREFLAWLGGFTDGEGSFCIRKAKKKSRTHRFPYGLEPDFDIANTNKEIIEFIQVKLAKFRITGYLLTIRRGSSKHKPAYHLQIRNCKMVHLLIKLLLPYLRLKKLQAETLLEFIELRFKKIKKAGSYQKARYGPEEYVIFDRLKLLNRRGPQDSLVSSN